MLIAIDKGRFAENNKEEGYFPSRHIIIYIMLSLIAIYFIDFRLHWQ